MDFELDSLAWARKTFGEAKLGDRRRTERLVKLAMAVANNPELSLPEAAADPAEQEGAYRFVRSDKIETQDIAEAGFDSTKAEASELDLTVYLGIGDTTSVNFASSPAEDLGDVGGGENVAPKGMFVHSVLLVGGETGRTIGLIEQIRWTRDPARRGITKDRRSRPYQERESYKWEQTMEGAAHRLGEDLANRTIFVNDRESDIWLFMAGALSRQRRFVIRACQPRALTREHASLPEMAARGKALGFIEAEVPQRGGRPARKARLELRSTRVTLDPPAHMSRDDSAPARVTVNVLRAREVGAPAGSRAGLEWLLLTTEPVNSEEQARAVLGYYCLRWRIEEFHKCWKSGARVEDLRMETLANLDRFALVKAFCAIRLLRMREATGHDTIPKIAGTLKPEPAQSCAKVLADDEWRVPWMTRQKSAPPSDAPSMQWAYYAIAGLGGWKDTKRTGRVGWKALWRGWDRLQQRVAGYRLSLEIPGE